MGRNVYAHDASVGGTLAHQAPELNAPAGKDIEVCLRDVTLSSSLPTLWKIGPELDSLQLCTSVASLPLPYWLRCLAILLP